MAGEKTRMSAPKGFGTTEVEVGQSRRVVHVIVTTKSKERLRKEAYEGPKRGSFGLC